MSYRAALLNFSKGAISPELESRFDLPMYQAGLRRAVNVKIKRTGGVSKRMGTRFVAEALSTSARLIPFQFSDNQAYALEFGQAYMRPLALGGAVLEDELQVIAITKATNANLTIHYHGYSVGDQVYLTGVTGMVEINDRWLTVLSVPDVHNFTVDFNSTMAGTFTGSGGGVDRTSAATAPDPAPTIPPPLPAPTPPPVTAGGGGGYTDGGGGEVVWDGKAKFETDGPL
jgi:hypothetical protein